MNLQQRRLLILRLRVRKGRRTCCGSLASYGVGPSPSRRDCGRSCGASRTRLRRYVSLGRKPDHPRDKVARGLMTTELPGGWHATKNATAVEAPRIVKFSSSVRLSSPGNPRLIIASSTIHISSSAMPIDAVNCSSEACSTSQMASA